MIRIATRYDIPRLLEIVEAYAYENPIKKLGQSHNHFPRYVEELLFSIIQGRGFIFIDTHLRGAIIFLAMLKNYCSASFKAVGSFMSIRILGVRLWLTKLLTFGRPK